MMEFNNDRFSKEHITNIYYPFSSRAEWELAFFLLLCLDLTIVTIDTFLSLKLVKTSFLQSVFLSILSDACADKGKPRALAD